MLPTVDHADVGEYACADPGLASAFTVSACTLSIMTAFGVPVGTMKPNQPRFSKPGSVSATAGTLGSCAERSLLVTASARSLPVLTKGNRRRQIGCDELDLPADEVADRRTLALVRHVGHVDAGRYG